MLFLLTMFQHIWNWRYIWNGYTVSKYVRIFSIYGQRGLDPNVERDTWQIDKKSTIRAKLYKYILHRWTKANNLKCCFGITIMCQLLFMRLKRCFKFDVRSAVVISHPIYEMQKSLINSFHTEISANVIYQKCSM